MTPSHYLDIRLLPDPEFSPQLLLDALYAKFHRALVQLSTQQIGVSFPQFSLKPKQLGHHMRVHGSEAELSRLQSTTWLNGMRDHTECSTICATPANALHCVFKRRQPKTNVERLRRRRMKRKGETAEQALEAIPTTVARKPAWPFVNLRSLSTGQKFCLFIERGLESNNSTDGLFNAYGLSRIATVPWF